VARIGGDEFAVVLPKLENREETNRLAEQIISHLSIPVSLTSGFGHVGASIGVAYCDDGSMEPSQALQLSDQAMYLAKSAGKNRVAFYEEKKAASIRSRAEQIQMIQSGVDNDWFEIALQPIINIETMQPYAFEALLRIGKSGIQLGSIESLIRVAEETGQMEKLGNWILDESVEQFRKITSGLEGMGVSISINLSPQQLNNNLVTKVSQIIETCPDLKGRLIFEITETAAMSRFEDVCRLLGEIKRLGIRIAIDDFGTGYSSLSYISSLPVDIVKLDKSFTNLRNGVGDRQQTPGVQNALIRSVANLASELGMETIAEGLEHRDVVDHVNSLGIKLGQGYLFSNPMPSSQARLWLEELAEQAGFGKSASRLKLTA